jgi:hypothetical protein
MGFWVSTPNIQRLIAKLDWKFSDAHIGRIKNDPVRLARFNPANNRNLRKIARLMRIWPGASANNSDALKWYGFLAWLHQQQNAATGNTVAQDIRAAIYAALTNPNDCVSISFVAIEGADVRLTSSTIQVGQGPEYVLVLVLQTIDAGGVTAADPGRKDGNDSEDDPGEDLPAVGFTRQISRARPAKKSKKSKKSKAESAKKSAKKSKKRKAAKGRSPGR